MKKLTLGDKYEQEKKSAKKHDYADIYVHTFHQEFL